MLQRSSLLLALLLLLVLPMTVSAAEITQSETAILDQEAPLDLESPLLEAEPLMSTEDVTANLSRIEPNMLGVPGCKTQQCPVDYFCLSECEAQYCNPYSPCGGPAFCSCARSCVIC